MAVGSSHHFTFLVVVAAVSLRAASSPHPNTFHLSSSFTYLNLVTLILEDNSFLVVPVLSFFFFFFLSSISFSLFSSLPFFSSLLLFPSSLPFFSSLLLFPSSLPFFSSLLLFPSSLPFFSSSSLYSFFFFLPPFYLSIFTSLFILLLLLLQLCSSFSE